MSIKITPSVNIVRDDNATINYHVTPNSKRTTELIFENFKRGLHCFNLIGSFGTGKSSYLWALEKTVKGEKKYFDVSVRGRVEFVKIVGDYKSFKEALNDEFGIEEDFSSNQKLFNEFFNQYSESIQEGLLFILVDEFGKFLEYAAKNNPEDEIYFLQKLAEFVNAQDRNIILITSLHQSLETYSASLEVHQVNEWRKVRGRFKDLTFNEPVEQLIYLAASFLATKQSSSTKFDTWSLIEKFKLFNTQSGYLKEVEPKLTPLSAISAYMLCLALQRYGQNERSLFTFLNSFKYDEILENSTNFEAAELYDYLHFEFYSYINSKTNSDYNNWAGIKAAIERVEALELDQAHCALDIVKTIGLMSVFSTKGASINQAFLVRYLSQKYNNLVIEKTIGTLTKNKIIRFGSFDDSYKLYEGTDVDIEQAIIDASNQIDSSFDILSKLTSHFSFPVITAKAITYQIGTPRLFEFKLTNSPLGETPVDEIDGFINLIFSEQIDTEKLIEFSKGQPILYGVFRNVSDIIKTLFDIEKTQKALQNVQDEQDRVAIKELRSILKSQEVLLNHYVMDSLYSPRVQWIALGTEVDIRSKGLFNQALSAICRHIYTDTPTLRNELFNKHKVSGAISSARKAYWTALVQNHHKEDLGFTPTKWPAEKTIYYSFLKDTGIHIENEGKFSLVEPTAESFRPLWNLSLQFLDEARLGRKSITDFMSLLSTAPMKLKQGVIDFWVSTFLFIKRGDFALYNDNGFIPFIDETILYMITRNPKEFYLKSFELNNLRLSLFNKYRNFLQQENKKAIDTNSFIESIRPLLIFYKDLSAYAKSTKTISVEAVAVRDAISQAKDPEKTFFEDFPQALNYNPSNLVNDNQSFDEYIIKFQNTIQEIKGAFDGLLQRFEDFICLEIIGKQVPFEEYKKQLQDRFQYIKEYEALTRHKIFLLRVMSKLDDRDSYLMSIGQAVIGKPMNQFKDTDEKLLYSKTLNLVKELDNLTDLNKIDVAENELLFKLELTTKTNGSKEQIIRLPKNKENEFKSLAEKFSKELSKNEPYRMAILISLLREELDKE